MHKVLRVNKETKAIKERKAIRERKGIKVRAYLTAVQQGKCLQRHPMMTMIRYG